MTFSRQQFSRERNEKLWCLRKVVYMYIWDHSKVGSHLIISLFSETYTQGIPADTHAHTRQTGSHTCTKGRPTDTCTQKPSQTDRHKADRPTQAGRPTDTCRQTDWHVHTRQTDRHMHTEGRPTDTHAHKRQTD